MNLPYEDTEKLPTMKLCPFSVTEMLLMVKKETMLRHLRCTLFRFSLDVKSGELKRNYRDFGKKNDTDMAY